MILLVFSVLLAEQKACPVLCVHRCKHRDPVGSSVLRAVSQSESTSGRRIVRDGGESRTRHCSSAR